MVAGALGATVMRNRLAAVLLVGVTGYGCGAIFAFHGAPDLALTQFLVETLTLVIFVLVLRTLPAEADAETMRRLRLPRALLAIAVGATVTGLAAFAMAARTTTPIVGAAARRRLRPRPRLQHRQRHPGRHPGLGHPRRDLGPAGGRDRGRVPGVPAPAFRRRATRPAGRRPARHRSDLGPSPRQWPYSPAVGDITWLRGSEYRDPRYRSLVLEVATRIIFPLIMVLSAVLLLHRAQHPGRRIRRRADRGPGAGAALSGGRPLRTRRDAAAGRRQDPRRRARPVGRHRDRVAVPGCAGAVVGADRVRRSACSATSSSSRRCSSTSGCT